MLSLKRGPVTVPATPLPSLSVPRPDGVQRLQPYEDRRAFAMDAAAKLDRTRSPTGHVVRVILGDAKAPNGGVAVFCPTTGAKLSWHPFSEFRETGGEQLELDLELPRGPATLTVAASREEARRRYLTRIDLAAAAQRPSATNLDLTTTTTWLEPHETLGSAGPFRLVRVGHPDWQPPDTVTAGIVLKPRMGLLLGPGDYELVDPIDQTNRQRFTVPSPNPVTVGLRLARPRAARR